MFVYAVIHEHDGGRDTVDTTEAKVQRRDIITIAVPWHVRPMELPPHWVEEWLSLVFNCRDITEQSLHLGTRHCTSLPLGVTQRCTRRVHLVVCVFKNRAPRFSDLCGGEH